MAVGVADWGTGRFYFSESARQECEGVRLTKSVLADSHDSLNYLEYYASGMPRSQARRNLFAIAKDQSGFFTTKQAKAAGFAEKTHPYHVQTGNWIREYRGIYRLADFPAVERPDLMVWYLWSRGRDEVPQGVYSHETALSLYELSDANPSKLHMTVPTTFRRNSEIPSVLVLHRGNIPPQDTQEMFAVRCTTPLRSIRDLVTEPQTDKVLLRQAVREALARGLTMRNDLDRKDFPTEVRRELRALAEGARRG